jgi:hypothetical protein
MSTMVAMPVRVKPPPGRHRRDHLARLRVLGNDHAVERRAHIQIVVVDASHGETAFGHLDLRLRGRKPRGQCVRFGARSFERRLAHELLLHQRLVALQVAARVREAHFDLGEIAACGFEFPLRHREHGGAVLGVEAREHLVLFDLHALLDVDLEHLARHLRRDRGHASRDHITRRIEYRCAQTRATRFCLRDHGGDFSGFRPQVEPGAGRSATTTTAIVA